MKNVFRKSRRAGAARIRRFSLKTAHAFYLFAKSFILSSCGTGLSMHVPDSSPSEVESIGLSVATNHSLPYLSTFSTGILYTAPEASVTLSCDGCPAGLRIESFPNELTWTPVPGQQGTHEFTIVATKGSVVERAPVKVTVSTRPYIQVTTTAHEVTPVTNGNCSLVEAIEAANTDAAVDGCAAGSNVGTDYIYVPAGTYHSITSHSGWTAYPAISSNTRIVGDGENGTIIQRSDNALTGLRGTTAPLFLFFEVGSASAIVDLAELTLTGGAFAAYSGMGTLNTEHVSVTYSEYNTAIYSGGIVYAGTSNGGLINRTTFSDNEGYCWGGAYGAQIAGTVQIRASEFTNNFAGGPGCGPGGAIAALYGETIVRYSKFSGNSGTWGFHIAAANTAKLEIHDSEITGGGAGGVLLWGSANKLIENTTLKNTGYIAISSPDEYTGSGGTVTIRNTYIENNGTGMVFHRTGNKLTLEDVDWVNASLSVRYGDVQITRGSMSGSSAVPAFDLVHDNGTTGITLNDSGDVDTGASGLLNFPVLETAQVVGSNLNITGYVGAGAQVQVYLSDSTYTSWGQGSQYLFNFTEGSAADTDSSIATYGPTVAGSSVGTDTASKFAVSIPLSSLPAGVTGRTLTSLATFSGATSEFSNTVPVQ